MSSPQSSLTLLGSPGAQFVYVRAEPSVQEKVPSVDKIVFTRAVSRMPAKS